MIKTFTQKDLIRCLYHETTEEEEREINSAIEKDPELSRQYTELRAAKSLLNQAMDEPGNDTVARIMAYVRTSRKAR